MLRKLGLLLDALGDACGSSSPAFAQRPGRRWSGRQKRGDATLFRARSRLCPRGAAASALFSGNCPDGCSAAAQRTSKNSQPASGTGIAPLGSGAAPTAAAPPNEHNSWRTSISDGWWCREVPGLCARHAGAQQRTFLFFPIVTIQCFFNFFSLFSRSINSLQ